MSITELRALIHEAPGRAGVCFEGPPKRREAGLGSRDLLERNDFLQRAKEAQKILRRSSGTSQREAGPRCMSARTKVKTEESTSSKASSSKAATGSSTKAHWTI